MAAVTCPTLARMVADYAKRVAARTAHDVNCEFHTDQYPQECTCGLTKPKAEWFVAWKGGAK